MGQKWGMKRPVDLLAVNDWPEQEQEAKAPAPLSGCALHKPHPERQQDFVQGLAQSLKERNAQARRCPPGAQGGRASNRRALERVLAGLLPETPPE